jgi:hypothetical protein
MCMKQLVKMNYFFREKSFVGPDHGPDSAICQHMRMSEYLNIMDTGRSPTLGACIYNAFGNLLYAAFFANSRTRDLIVTIDVSVPEIHGVQISNFVLAFPAPCACAEKEFRSPDFVSTPFRCYFLWLLYGGMMVAGATLYIQTRITRGQVTFFSASVHGVRFFVLALNLYWGTRFLLRARHQHITDEPDLEDTHGISSQHSWLGTPSQDPSFALSFDSLEHTFAHDLPSVQKRWHAWVKAVFWLLLAWILSQSWYVVLCFV